MKAQDMYREEILDHYKNPRNKGKLKTETVSHKEINPLCGDEIKIMLKIKSDKIEDIGFIGTGCAISQASISMLTEKIKGMKISDVKKIKKEDVLRFLGIPISPVRIKCALLSFDTLKNTIKIYETYKK
ncbi:MAG: Fe-S cluster assembly sulfur transfer protein SufU [archaeon]